MRHGYTQPPLLLRLVGVHDLLCDSCNLSYRGFAIPGTVPQSSRKRRSRSRETSDDAARGEVSASRSTSTPHAAATDDSHGGGLLAFLSYYIKLRLDILIGRHRTPRPLGLVWRWRHWQKRKR
ncbi:MAG TPA: hypothetical protein VJT82_04100 [Pyrinomonadaceae bacterium]|nr:hypothetical protein [Pyrinomonadaceae bacterium]